MDGEIGEIYLDNHASTPVDPRVFDTMEPYFSQNPANPGNDIHRAGQDAAIAVQTAKQRVADSIGAQSDRSIIFTSGATESDNLALRGPIQEAISNGEAIHIITTAIEHDAIRKTAEYLEKRGVSVTYLPVDQHGRVDLEDVQAEIREETQIISVMTANNEIGTLQPINEIANIASENDILFHTDAVQAIGQHTFDVEESNIDMISISGHKIYGPKGIGALYLSWPDVKNQVDPIIFGGGHQDNIRSGTLNVPGCVGLGKAAQLADSEMESRTAHLESLRDRLWDNLTDSLDDVILNGHPEYRLASNLNISFLGTNNYQLVSKLSNEHGIFVAAGSACSTDQENQPVVKTSHVLEEITTDEERLKSAVRIGIGKDTTKEQVDNLSNTLIDIVSTTRKRFS